MQRLLEERAVGGIGISSTAVRVDGSGKGTPISGDNEERKVSGGPIRSPIRLTPNWILSTIYIPEESLGRPPPAGTPAALTYDLTLASLTTNPNLR
jgi:hypothetical protein